MVLRIKESAYGPEHRWIVSALEDYAELFDAMGDERAAEELEARVRSIQAR